METVVVHGTINGHKIFYPEEIKITGLTDARDINADSAPIGQEAYSLQFRNNDYIISKYRIVRDKEGNRRVGYVAVSIFFPYNKKMPGAEIQFILDEMALKCNKFIKNNDLVGIGKEDCGFIEDFRKKYINSMVMVPCYDIENYETGTKDAAFIYYGRERGKRLRDYFDAPFQEEYKGFKQIFFVDSELEGKDKNPLNALEHGHANDLTGKIDLSEYELNFGKNTFGNSKTVTIKGYHCPEKLKIKKKHDIEITISKQFHKTKTIKGKLHEIDAAFIEVNEKEKYACLKDIELEKVKKTIKFILLDKNKNRVYNPYVKINGKIGYRLVDNELVFEGDDIGKEWNMMMEKNNLREQKYFIPDKEKNEMIVTLQTVKKIRIIAKDKASNENIDKNLTIILDKIHKINDNEIEFYGEEIFKAHSFEISHNDYKSANKEFFPYNINDDEIHIELVCKYQQQNMIEKDSEHFNAGQHVKQNPISVSKKTDGTDRVEGQSTKQEKKTIRNFLKKLLR